MKVLLLAIFRTLVYADIFDYPLTAKEVWKYLISEEKVDFWAIQTELRRKNELIAHKGIYFFLKNRQKVVKIRKNRQKCSQKKLKIARRVAKWLKIIPWIKLVGVTGALAMENADKNDDIDLLIIAVKNRLWLTRLLTVFLVEFIAHRRRPGDTNVCNKICLNMFLDEAHLKVPKKEQNLFTAHEIIQLKPIWDKNDAYKKFIMANLWVKKFLANWKV